ncbi:armadillo-domain containing rhoptry protein, putative (ARO) [Plasmodium ovale curtisi]|uniref:Armadillo-domain containing rhoptry protein, putative (ARO) n=1 Tax=Plasmodium ovale curtisi TaxID=864141 RepID=A0A1A8VQ68_PLAOA|nr:armadillo-domain containing rhoptry protein, putative (ARO) [Plasmodium ovale curtisi]
MRVVEKFYCYKEGLQDEKLKENKVVTKLEAKLTDMTKEKVKDNFCNVKSVGGKKIEKEKTKEKKKNEKKKNENERNVKEKNDFVCNDILRFDKAYDENDVQEFVNLCSSGCEIEKLEDRMHPWAADPKTIGALSATQLAILANEPHYKDAIREADGIPVFINLLKSHVRTTSFQCVGAEVCHVKNCISMFDNGAMSYLISGMKSSIDGMKAACAQTCRNIFVLDKKYKKEFLKLGGITQLVKLLELYSERNKAGKTPSNYNDSQPLYTQLEAIYHLEDFILNDGDEVPEFLEAVKNSNAIKNLKNLQQGGGVVVLKKEINDHEAMSRARSGRSFKRSPAETHGLVTSPDPETFLSPLLQRMLLQQTSIP